MKAFILFALSMMAVSCGTSNSRNDTQIPYEARSLDESIVMEPPRNAEPPPPPSPTIYEEEEVLEQQEEGINGDRYQQLPENNFVDASDEPVSTFSIDADGASYANVRSQLNAGHHFPASVRTEEFINYFDLDYPYTDPSKPINLNGEVSSCPWAPGHQLVRVGIQGRPLPEGERPPANFVFLIDVSGSMADENRLPLLKAGFKLFVDELTSRDRVAIVTYAGSAGVVLDATPGDQKAEIKRAIDRLGAGGSTAGAEGILTAYDILERNYLDGGNNRVVIGTDGDFNVGPQSHEQILELIETKREKNIFLTTLGVGRGNYNDYMLEQLANKGNGTAEYIDNIQQLRKVFIYDYNKFYTVAKDVKVQVKFNPATVASYRLIGYENRALATEDFLDDAKDAGEIGAGQNVTALYEIVPANRGQAGAGPAFTVNFRYKEPGAIVSQPLQLEVFDEGKEFTAASPQHQFAGGVAAFAMLLRGSRHAGSASFSSVQEWLAGSGATDAHGLKQELYELVGRAAAK